MHFQKPQGSEKNFVAIERTRSLDDLRVLDQEMFDSLWRATKYISIAVVREEVYRFVVVVVKRTPSRRLRRGRRRVTLKSL